MYIVTHVSPDMDAIGAVWLLQRFGGMEGAEIKYVNTGAPDPAVLEGAAAVVDTGREYDPARLRFDHHHLPGRAASETCATLQVFYHLTSGGGYNHPLFYLNQIAALITSGDTGRKTDGADWSRIEGIHAMLSALKMRGAADYILMNYGCSWLDLIAEHSLARYEAQRALASHLVYASEDQLVVALRDAPPHATSAAMEQGARLVVFANYAENAIGIMRAGEWQKPHCGELVGAVCADTIVGPRDEAIVSELLTWYRHQAGFFAGRGTKKAPREDKIAVDLADVARAIDQNWKR